MKTVVRFLSLLLVYSFSLHAEPEQKCRELDVQAPHTIMPALAACSAD